MAETATLAAVALRKYTTETTLVLTVELCYLGRQQDFAATPLPEDDGLHLYVVSRRPLVRIRPESVVIDDTDIRATVGIQHGEAFSETVVRTSHSFGQGLTWHSEWPYDEFSLRNPDGDDLVSGNVAHLSTYFDGWPDVAHNHEVVYVGQAFGKQGERTAWDRLQSHSTVQKILADTPRDQQVWITMAAVSDVQLVYEMVPGPTATTDDEDNRHVGLIIEALERGDFRDKEAVALAEAGMIRHFQPRYNDRLKYRFPARESVPLETARALDLHTLVVEVQSDSVRNRYGSPTQLAQYVHFAAFTVHMDEGREETLSLQAAKGRVVGG